MHQGCKLCILQDIQISNEHGPGHVAVTCHDQAVGWTRQSPEVSCQLRDNDIFCHIARVSEH